LTIKEATVAAPCLATLGGKSQTLPGEPPAA
jgi:hypothetical protein